MYKIFTRINVQSVVGAIASQYTIIGITYIQCNEYNVTSAGRKFEKVNNVQFSPFLIPRI